MSVSLSFAKPLHGFDRTDAETITAVKAVASINAAGDRIADTPRRTNTSATLAADTLLRNDMVPVFLGCHAAKGKALAIGRKLPQIKILALALIDLKDLQCLPAFFRGVNLSHVRVFLENLSQPVFSDVPHCAPQGNCQGG